MKEKESFAEVFDIHGFRIVVKTYRMLLVPRSSAQLFKPMADLRIISRCKIEWIPIITHRCYGAIWNTIGITN